MKKRAGEIVVMRKQVKEEANGSENDEEMGSIRAPRNNTHKTTLFRF